MSTEIHDCDVWTSNDEDGLPGWVAECSCGWQGKMFDPDEHAKAVDAWENHCEQVFMAATGG